MRAHAAVTCVRQKAHAWANFELIVRLCLWTFECVNLRRDIVWGGVTVLVMQGMRDPTLSSTLTVCLLFSTILVFFKWFLGVVFDLLHGHSRPQGDVPSYLHLPPLLSKSPVFPVFPVPPPPPGSLCGRGLLATAIHWGVHYNSSISSMHLHRTPTIL
jgi:hypothetical protein